MNKLLTIWLLTFSIITAGNSQNSILSKKINVNFSNNTINEAVEKLSRKTHYYFSYDAELIKNDKKITFKAEKLPLSKILTQIFETELKFTILNNHIIINRKNSTLTEKFQKNSTKHFSGKIIDAKSKLPVPYAAINIGNTGKGIVSNQNGVFNLNLPPNYIDSSLLILNLAYKNYKIKISQLKDTNNIIELIPEFIPIEEVIIRNKDPKEILYNFLNNIKYNYSRSNYLITAFYREYVKSNKKLRYYTEALIKINKRPYKANLHHDQIKLLKSRKIYNAGIKDTLSVKLKDGLYTSLYLDIVKNDFDFINPEKMLNYDYQISDILAYDNKTVYAVSFKQKQNITKPLFYGTLYIENKNFALVAAEFGYNLKYEKNNLNFISKKPGKYKINPFKIMYYVSYKKVDGKYCLNRVKANMEFKIKKKHHIFFRKYRLVFETAAVDYQKTDNIRFKKKEMLKKNQIFIDMHFEYDASFWKNCNYIAPEEDIKKILKKFNTAINISE